MPQFIKFPLGKSQSLNLYSAHSLTGCSTRNLTKVMLPYKVVRPYFYIFILAFFFNFLF